MTLLPFHHSRHKKEGFSAKTKWILYTYFCFHKFLAVKNLFYSFIDHTLNHTTGIQICLSYPVFLDFLNCCYIYNAVPSEFKWLNNSQIPPLKPQVHKKKNIVFKQGILHINRRRKLNKLAKLHKRSMLLAKCVMKLVTQRELVG